MGRVRSFLSEMLRRKVVRLLCAYIALFWLLTQGFASIFPPLGVPDAILRIFMVAGIAVIPLLAFVSWKYNFLPPQLVRDPKDAGNVNPMFGWAARRHDNADAGHLILRWESPVGEQHQKRFSTPVAIGRVPENDIALGDQFVSRFHAVLWAEDGEWHLRDIDSTNGTYIEGRRVVGDVVLPETCELRFHMDGPVVAVDVDKPEATAVRTEV